MLVRLVRRLFCERFVLLSVIWVDEWFLSCVLFVGLCNLMCKVLLFLCR